jgi:hypothetical protein
MVPFLLKSHVALSVLAIFNSQILPSQYSTSLQDNDIEECFDAKHYDMVQRFVTRMYNGTGFSKGEDHNNVTNIGSITGYNYADDTTVEDTERGVRMTNAVTFEDPAAICKGIHEVQEAFRALKALHPESESPPRCVDVQPLGNSIVLTFVLNQQYQLPLYGALHLRSFLDVTVELQQMKDNPESEFLITRMKESWNGKPLAWPYMLYYPSRRLNGILSYRFTSWFL